MRIAFVSSVTAHTAATESTERMRRTAQLLAERGHEVTVFCSRWWDGERETFSQNDVTYRAVTTDPESTGRFTLGLPLALRRTNPDVLHAVYPSSGQVLSAKAASALLRTPLVVDWYGTADSRQNGAVHAAAEDGKLKRTIRDTKQAMRLYGRKLSASTPDMVFTPSRTVKTRVRESGANGNDVRVVPNSIDLAQIRDVTPVNVADIVYSRRLDENANLESLLLALAELRDKDWTAAVIGDGPERRNYERQARDLRIDDRVTFAGDQPLEKRLSTFKGAHVYVQTARRESFPTDLLRAMACGCLGVVEYHAESSAHELVENKDRGFRTTSEDELTETLRTAADIPHQTRNEEFDEYGNDALFDAYLNCYKDVQESFGLF